MSVVTVQLKPRRVDSFVAENLSCPRLRAAAQGYLDIAERVMNGLLEPAEARVATRAIDADLAKPQLAVMHDHEALCGFVHAASTVGHADAAAMLAALIKRTGASDRELLLAALDVVRVLTAARRETGA